MPVAETTGIQLEEYQPAADRAALEQLAGWCEQYSPLVGLEDAEPPASLLLDVTGVSSLFGGEQSLAEQVARAFARRDLLAHLALADTVGAAWAVAHHTNRLCIVLAGETRAALASLPVAALRLSAGTLQVLRQLGIRHIGELLSLPPASLASRFDPELIQRLYQALGLAPEQLATYRAIPEIVVQRSLEYPVAQRKAIDAILAQLIDQVAAALAARGEGAIQLECQLDCEAAQPVRLTVGLFQASSQPRHLRELVQARLERLALPAPVVAVRLSVVFAARLQSRQRSLFGDNHDHRRQLGQLVDRLSSRLDPEAVVRPVLVSDAQPEYAYRYELLVGNQRRRTKEKETRRGAPQRPLQVEPRPLHLEVLAVAPDGPPIQFRFRGQDCRVAQCWGPERVQTGWWRGNYIRRDYYRVETTAGNRLWLFRRNGNWFLHGVFD